MATIALYGSGEFLPWSTEVDRWCLGSTAADGDRVLILPTASAPEGDEVFDRWAGMGVEHYRGQGLAPEVLAVKTRSDAMRGDVAARVAGARLIFFSGGNPGYLSETLAGTPLWRAVVEAVAGGTALAGCSAGAVFLGTLAPFLHGDRVARWVPGLSLLAEAYISPHFDRLDSYGPGLRTMVMSKRPEGSVFVGIDEDTALCGDGERWEVLGGKGVWIGADGITEPTGYHRGEQLAVPLGLRLA